MKVLFLDVDGVLNSMEFFAKMPATKHLDMVDPKPVRRVLRVLRATGAAIALSSTWRAYPALIDKLEEAGLPLCTLPPTPQLPEGALHRHHEIRAWLAEYGPVERFAIIDDDADAGAHPELAPYFVKTHAKYGMYGKHEKQLIEILGAA